MRNLTRNLVIAASASIIAIATLVLLSNNDDTTSASAAPREPTKAAPRGVTSFMSVADEVPFATRFAQLSAEKDGVMKRQTALLRTRYDLSDRAALGLSLI